MKKPALIIMLLVICFPVSALAGTFPEKYTVSIPSAWAQPYIFAAESMTLYPIDPISPKSYIRDINRGELAELAVSVYEAIGNGIVLSAETLSTLNGEYSDAHLSEAVYKAISKELMFALGTTISDGAVLKTFDANKPVTREQAAVVLNNIYSNYMPAQTLDTTIVFADSSAISPWAKEAVETMASLKIISGSNNYFMPKSTCKYEDAVIMSIKLIETINQTNLASGSHVLPAPAVNGLNPGETIAVKEDKLAITWQPVDNATGYVIDVQENDMGTVRTRYFASNENGYALSLTGSGKHHIQVRAVGENNFISNNAFDLYAIPFAESILTKASPETGGTYAVDPIIFSGNGTVSENPFSSEEEALLYMQSVTFPVWIVTKDGNKAASEKTILVNKDVADDVIQIFTEIFQGAEQFPIYEVSGFSWRGVSSTSSHNLGLAIDLNANENYYINANGDVLAGSFWNPTESIYSIPQDGDVVRAFAKYGWYWGGFGWNTGKDYMHFSQTGV